MRCRFCRIVTAWIIAQQTISVCSVICQCPRRLGSAAQQCKDAGSIRHGSGYLEGCACELHLEDPACHTWISVAASTGSAVSFVLMSHEVKILQACTYMAYVCHLHYILCKMSCDNMPYSAHRMEQQLWHPKALRSDMNFIAIGELHRHTNMYGHMRIHYTGT